VTDQPDLNKLLVLRGPAIKSKGMLADLAEHFQMTFVDDLDSAIDAMRGGQFAAVLAETADFLPLERGIVSQQASVVLDTIGDGVCIADSEGQLVWANRRLRQFPKDHLELLQKSCRDIYEQFAAQGQIDQNESRATRRFSLTPDDGTYYEVICSSVIDSQGILRQIAAVVVNATNQRRQQQKFNAIDRAGRELVQMDLDVLARQNARDRLSFIEEKIIDCSKDILNYEHFAVLLTNVKTNRLEVVISAGLDEVIDRYQLFANAEGNGICGYVAATGQSYICPDCRSEPMYIRGMADARSSLTVPLRLHGRVIGVLNAESSLPSTFGEGDRQFAEMFANHVALALHVLNLLVFERHAVHNQVSGSICAELAGPLNDLITGVSEIMEDYMGHDDLRKRLGALIDTATEARGLVQQLSTPGELSITGQNGKTVSDDPILNGKRILVADDEQLMRETISDVLGGYGCDVEIAADGSEALSKIAQGAFDLVISDIKMPGADGYEVYAAAKDANSDTQVILITGFGYDPNHAILRSRDAGLTTVIMKPFKVKRLLEECRKALSMSNKH